MIMKEKKFHYSVLYTETSDLKSRDEDFIILHSLSEEPFSVEHS